LLLSPYAPHFAEEVWRALGHPDSLAFEPWPEYDEALTKEDTLEIPVQINGKLRETIPIPAVADCEQMVDMAKSHPRIAQLLDGKKIVKEVCVPGRLVNFVVK
jgi:leucyl-tRNA synthetase